MNKIQKFLLGAAALSILIAIIIALVLTFVIPKGEADKYVPGPKWWKEAIDWTQSDIDSWITCNSTGRCY